MDNGRFDHLTKSLARESSRRTVLKGLAASLVAGVALSRGQPSEAFICRQPGVLCAKDAHCCSDSCVDHHCACPDGGTLCGRTCFDLSTDVTNCGACGHVCTTAVAHATATCSAGVCGFVCNPGFHACEGTCIADGQCCTHADCASLTDQCHQGSCQSDRTCIAQVTAGVLCEGDTGLCDESGTCQVCAGPICGTPGGGFGGFGCCPGGYCNGDACCHDVGEDVVSCSIP